MVRTLASVAIAVDDAAAALRRGVVQGENLLALAVEVERAGRDGYRRGCRQDRDEAGELASGPPKSSAVSCDWLKAD